MVAVSTTPIPKCGLYATTRALPGADEVRADILVNFHDHSDIGGPVVHLPAISSFNRWSWEKAPHRIAELSWLESLKPLKPEGYYVLREKLQFEEAEWPTGSIVQLGYDRHATPLIFLAQRRFHLAENTLFFAERGVPLGRERLHVLEQLVVYEEPDPNASGAEAAVKRH